MARPQRALDVTKPLHAFAAELRKLRASVGDPKYLTMARKVGDISRTALSEAAGGDHLPSWRTVEKYVLACGGDPNEWRTRWEELRDEVSERSEQRGASAPPQVSEEPLVDSAPGRWLGRRRLLIVAAAVAVLLAVAAGLVARPFLAGDGNGDGRTNQGGSVAGGNPSPIPTGPAVIVQNMIAIGADSLIEDSVPAYLSTKPIPRCRLNGCMIPDTILPTGMTVVATCYVHGTRMSNYNLDSTEVQRNAHRVRSTLWYRLLLPDGRAGYLAEVYVAPASRGGLGLPTCAHDVPITGV